MQYEILMFWDDGAQMWGVQVPDLPGCSAQGTSVAQAERHASEAIQNYISDLKMKGRRVPAPSGHLLKAVDVDLSAAATSDASSIRKRRSVPELRLFREPSTTRSVFVQGMLEGFGTPGPVPLNLVARDDVDTVA